MGDDLHVQIDVKKIEAEEPTQREKLNAFRETAGEFIIDAFEGTEEDLDDRYAVAMFADAIEDLTIYSDDTGVELVESGRYAPEGVIGDYPPLWAEFEITGAVWQSVEALNSEHVRIHLLEQMEGKTLLKLAPAIDAE